jgi:hypothetical protein
VHREKLSAEDLRAPSAEEDLVVVINAHSEIASGNVVTSSTESHFTSEPLPNVGASIPHAALSNNPIYQVLQQVIPPSVFSSLRVPSSSRRRILLAISCGYLWSANPEMVHELVPK